MDLEDVAGIPTEVFSLLLGGEEGGSTNVPLVLVIPGSPGVGCFYKPFATKLYDLGGGNFEVVVLSHAGHSPAHYKEENLTQKSKTSIELSPTDWYTLQDQIAHKLAYIRLKVHPDRPLILVGHSIGCWVILHMLKQLPASRVSKVIFLFPTIEKMAQTPNALSYYSTVWNSMRIPFTGLVWAASRMIPYGMKSYILHHRFRTTPEEHRPSIVEAAASIDEKSLYNIVKMAAQEMEEVVEVPWDILDCNIDKLIFYYGVHDKWNVKNSFSDMATRYPGKEVHICPEHFPHAFVETVSNEMAEMVFKKL